MEKITVIIPAYNAELFLDECIRSVVGQTYVNMDILIIDDGSTDETGKICDDWSGKDNRIRVIHQDNRGLVLARRTGIENAFGNYCCFVDADDIVENSFVSTLVGLIEDNNADLACALAFESPILENDWLSGLYIRDDSEASIFRNFILRPDGKESSMLSASVWGKLYKTKLYRECQKDIDVNVTYGEDNMVVWRYIMRCSAIVLSDKRLYHYIKRDSGMSRTFDPNYLKQIGLLHNDLKRAIESHPDREHFMLQLDDYIFRYRILEKKEKYLSDSSYVDIYLLPFEMIPIKSKVIIWGTGVVGRSFYAQLEDSDYCSVVGWTNSTLDYGNELDKKDWDCILISVKHEKDFLEIRNLLLDKGVTDKKIIWKKPIRKIGMILSQGR